MVANETAIARWRVPDVGESVGVDTYKMYEYMRKEENETAKRSETLSPCCDIMRRIPVLRFIFLFDMINGERARSHHLKELML
jgi:hypothetical protein